MSLSVNFSSLEELINTGIEELLMIRDIGPIVANSILDFFKDIKNLDNIDRLIEKGVEIIYQSENDSQILSGKTFVITGTLKNMTRSEAKNFIENNGGKVTSAVSKNTNYLLAGDNPGSKIKKAEDIGVSIINEDQMLDLIKYE